MKELWITVLQSLGLAWWVEVTTELPRCTYYFGPFDSVDEANASKKGYIEDLEQEGAQGIKVEVKRCKPNRLTVFDEPTDTASSSLPPLFSSQT